MKTLVGLIPDDERVMKAREALQVVGLEEGAFSAVIRPADAWKRLSGPGKLRVAFRHALFGALLGLAAGAFYGVPSGVLNCSLMGCPVRTSIALLVLICVYWVLAGAFLGVIVGADRLEQNLYSYVEGVRHGATLLIVDTPDELTSEVERILRRESSLLVHSLEGG